MHQSDGGCDVFCGCPDYARSEPDNRFCSEGSLFQCSAVWVEGCGWSCTVEPVQPCTGQCADPEDGRAYCCGVPEITCPDYATGGEGRFCHDGDLYICAEVPDPYCGFAHVGLFMESCPEECVDGQDGSAYCCTAGQCSVWEWNCADYLEPQGGTYCVGDDLYTCSIGVSLVDCNCWADGWLTQHCDRGCNDNLDGQADCNP
jgi:hypothetical protein